MTSARNAHLSFRIVRSKVQEHADLPRPLSQLSLRHERPYQRATRADDEFSSPDVDCHAFQGKVTRTQWQGRYHALAKDEQWFAAHSRQAAARRTV
jgi:hypothetical protein